MPSINILSLRITVRSPTLIGLDFPLITLVGIVSKRKQFLTCTQKISRASLSDYAQQDLSMTTKKIISRHAEV
jgi:hypothetical protein